MRRRYIQPKPIHTTKVNSSLNTLLNQVGTQGLSTIAQKYLEELEEALMELNEAKELLTFNLKNYVTVLETLVQTQVLDIDSLTNGRIDLNYLSKQFPSLDGAFDIALERYQHAVAEGQHKMNQMLEVLNNGKMQFNIGIVGTKASQGLREISLDIDQMFKLESDTNFMNIGVSGKDLKSMILGTFDYSQLKFSQHTSKNIVDENGNYRPLTADIFSKYIESKTGARETVLDSMAQTQWKEAQKIGRANTKDDKYMKVKRSDAYEAFTKARYGAYDLTQNAKNLRWTHDSVSAAVAGDVNVWTQDNRFLMIQNKLFSQAWSQSEVNFEGKLAEQFYGFFTLSNLDNVQDALETYIYRLQNPEFTPTSQDELRMAQMDEEVMRNVVSLWCQDELPYYLQSSYP